MASRPGRTRRILSVATAALLGGALLVACSDAEEAEDSAPVYVALGDSYTAGPLIPQTDRSDGCLRSDHNYPSLVAEAQGYELVDVSCTGATTSNLVEPQEQEVGTVSPQFEALEEDPDVVTISMGANDENVASLVLSGCGTLARRDPTGSPCRQADARLERPLLERVAATQRRLTTALRELRERVPDARILVVGYPQVFPATGTCPGRIPHNPADYPWALRINRALDQAVRSAAEQTGTELVDPWQASQGHDICSEEPWINGARNAPDALAYHPFVAYQEAVADLVLDRL